MKLDKILVVYLFVALARILYGIDGVVSHYMFHFDDLPIATYISAVVGIIIAIALCFRFQRGLHCFLLALMLQAD